MVLDLGKGLYNMKFNVGQVLMTNGVSSLITDNDKFAKFVAKSFIRHCNGDWGDLDGEDIEMNDKSLRNGERLFSKYNFDGETSIYIITEWDRSATTILFPEEY